MRVLETNYFENTTGFLRCIEKDREYVKNKETQRVHADITNQWGQMKGGMLLTLQKEDEEESKINIV